MLKPPRELTVSYLGPAGTHSHLAAIELFGPTDSWGFRYQNKENLMGVVNAVSSGEAGWGVIPYFNTASGPVKQVYPALLDVEHGLFSGLEVCGCISSHISQDLLSSGLLEEIKTVYSKKEAFEQCSNTLQRILPQVKYSYYSSTAEAASRAEGKGPQAAAIASRRLLPFHRGLKLLKEGIQDARVNVTRFLVVRGAGDNVDKSNNKEEFDCRRHTWLVFSSSFSDDVLSKMLSAAQRWGISASAISGTVIDPIDFRMRFLMELSWPLNSLKVRFFLSEIAHLSPQLIGSPIIASFENINGLRKWIMTQVNGDRNLLTEEDAYARRYLKPEVINLLDKINGNRLYIHFPVSSMESVWQVLGIEPHRMLNTQICYDSDVQKVAFCSVLGGKRVDTGKVSKCLSGNYRRANQSEIKQLDQTVGAVSPFTAPQDAALLIDKRINSENLMFMGSGHIGISIALKFRADKLPINIKIADISEDE